MRTKKAGRANLDVESPGEESDGAGSDLDRLPDDSSSDDDVGGMGRGKLSGAGVMGLGQALVGLGHALAGAGGTLGDQRGLMQAHTALPGGAALGQGQSHVSNATRQPGVDSPAGGAAGAGHAHGLAAGAAGAHRPTVTPQHPPSSIEDPTVRRIKAQMRAVWLLQRDLPVPPVLLAETKSANAKIPSTTPHDMAPVRPWSAYDNLVSTLCIAQHAADNPSSHKTGGAAADVARTTGEGFVRASHGAQEPRPGLVEYLVEQSKQHMSGHMKRRAEFLKHVATTNMPTHVAERLHLEHRQLQLFQIQHEVRRALLASHVDAGVPAPHQMALFKTRETRLDSAVVQEESKEEWEGRMREAEVQSKLNKRKAFLMDMQKTHRNFNKEHDTIRRWREQICKGIKMWHRNAEKSKEKERSERLTALKSNDFDKYREFVKEAKNERLMELIHKTDGYLESLAAKMSKTSKMINDSAKTDSMLELGHKILPLEGDAEGENAGGEAGGTKTEGGDENEDGSKKGKSSQELDNIFDGVKSAEVVIKQPIMMGDGDDLKSKVEGKPPMLLKPYQLQGVQWLATLYNNNLSGILADEMGLGKTIQVIGLLTYLVESRGDQGPFMIIAPLSTITNWKLEFDKWAPTLNVVVYKGNKDVRKELFRTRIKGHGLHVIIIQYEMAMSTPDLRMLKQIKWSYMVVDEGHRLKNNESKLFVVLTKEYESKRKLILTGTPLQTNIGELWNLLNFILPTVFDTDADFKTWFSKPFAHGDETAEDEEASQEEQMVLINRLHQVLRPFMLRRTKNDKDLELSLPENREVVIKCTLSALQKIQYRQLSYATLRTRDEKGNLISTSYNNTIMQLRKVCNHPYTLEDPEWDLGSDMRVRVCGKLDVLDRILPKLKAAGHRVLIYSQMVKLLEILAEYIEDEGYKYHKLIGATSSDMRATMIEDFNKPDSDIFLFILSTRAGGQGVNLQTADTVIIFDSDWNPTMDEQAKARINRIGQTKQTLVIRLMTPGTIEEKMLSRANERLRMGDLVVEAGAFKVGCTSKDAQALLREKLDHDSFLPDIAQIDHEMASDEEINELIMRTEEELVMWGQMDLQRLQDAIANHTHHLPRLMQEDEVPESLLGERIETGDRVVLLDQRLATVGSKSKGHEWEVKIDDGSNAVVHRTELVLAAMEETEETYEASKIGRRRQTNRDHSISHHGMTDAEFTRCLESGKDIDQFVRDKKLRAEAALGKVSGKKLDDEAEGGGSSRKRDRSARKRSKTKRIDDDDDEEEEEEEDDQEDDGDGTFKSRSKRKRA